MSDNAARAVVVTGASTGIGFATCKVLVENGMRVFGSVRKPADGERVRAELGERFVPLDFDVTDEAAVHAGAARVATSLDGTTLFGLVNNAGIGIGGPLLHLPLNDLRRQFEVNLFGALSVTQAFAPLLGADRSRRGAPGRIVNMSSVAGKIGAPFIGPYVASKHALEGLSECLRRELVLYGIDVVIVGPGAVATPIWDKTEEQVGDAYDDTPFAPALQRFREAALASGRAGIEAEAVGRLVHEALTTAKPRVRYTILRRPFMGFTLPRLLPKRFVDRKIAERTGLLPPKQR